MGFPSDCTFLILNKIINELPLKIPSNISAIYISLLQNNDKLNLIDLDEIIQKVVGEEKKEDKKSLDLKNDFDMIIANETLTANITMNI